MKTNRPKLVATLEKVCPGLAKGKSAVQSGNRFIFKDKRVFTFNDEVGVSHPVDFDLTGAVAAQELFQLLKRHRSAEVDLEVVGAELHVNAGKTSKAGISIIEEEGSFHEEIVFPKKWHPLPEGFLPAINLARTVSSTDVSNVILTLINVSGQYATATDNIQVMAANMGAEIAEPFLLPATSAKDLTTYNPMEYGIVGGWVHFRNKDGVTYSVRTIEADYPDMMQYFLEGGEPLSIEGDWQDPLERIAIFAEQGGTGLVDVKGIKGGVALACQNDTGWCKERLRAKMPVGMQFTLPVDVLVDALKKSAEFRVTDSTIMVESKLFKYTACLTGDDGVEDPELEEAEASGQTEEG